MGTRATIGLADPDGAIEFIYLYDRWGPDYHGYPSGVGDILHRHYDDAATRRLIDLGRVDASQELHVKIGERDGYVAFIETEEQTQRDRNDYPASYRAGDPDGFLAHSLLLWADYIYLRQDGIWLAAHRGTNEVSSLSPLAETYLYPQAPSAEAPMTSADRMIDQAADAAALFTDMAEAAAAESNIIAGRPSNLAPAAERAERAAREAAEEIALYARYAAQMREGDPSYAITADISLAASKRARSLVCHLHFYHDEAPIPRRLGEPLQGDSMTVTPSILARSAERANRAAREAADEIALYARYAAQIREGDPYYAADLSADCAKIAQGVVAVLEGC